MTSALAFELPERLEAHAPPEARGLGRDGVRMLVARRADGRLIHARFRDLTAFLSSGDVLVINTSGTLPAALPARRADGAKLDVHLSTPLPDEDQDRWVIELRRDGGRVRDGRQGDLLGLPAGGRLELLAPYVPAARLWIAKFTLPVPFDEYLARQGRPIRYAHMRAERPLADYQTVFATEPGSAEMPSAGRPFTTELITALVARGVVVAPLVLHAGVSSLEASEPPYPERFRVPASTARLVSAARAWGGRVIAVGTTVVRSLETVALPDGSISAGAGWTRVFVTPERGVRAVDGLLTGWHDPAASHLLILEAVAGRDLVRRSYEAALAGGYLWHEFGDVHLILP
jgi:S-adenosylmethionine:tRNA ribosyltransferase-isomerase